MNLISTIAKQNIITNQRRKQRRKRKHERLEPRQSTLSQRTRKKQMGKTTKAAWVDGITKADEAINCVQGPVCYPLT